MKQIFTTLVFVAFCSVLSAQYKKASFFEKSGRTYGIGIQAYAFGDGKGTVPGINFSFGRDQAGKRFFSFWEIRLIPSYKFKLETTTLDEEPITVTGKSKMQVIYAMNYGWHILNPDNTDRKFSPYLTAGFNIKIFGGRKEFPDESINDNIVRKVPKGYFSTGLGGGLGGLVKLSGNWSLKLEGGYTWQGNVATNYDGDGDEYFMLTTHPYASAGVRYRIEAE